MLANVGICKQQRTNIGDAYAKAVNTRFEMENVGKKYAPNHMNCIQKFQNVLTPEGAHLPQIPLTCK